MRANFGDLVPAVLFENLNDFPAVYGVYIYTLYGGLSTFMRITLHYTRTGTPLPSVPAGEGYVISSFLVTYIEYSTLRSAQKAGNFNIVEGKVTNFKPMPYSGHTMEKFCVNSLGSGRANN